MGFPDISIDKESACNAGDPVWIPGSGRSTGEGMGYPFQYSWASLVAQLVKNLPAMHETQFDPWVGKISWRRKWNPLQYSCLKTPMDRGACQATVKAHVLCCSHILQPLKVFQSLSHARLFATSWTIKSIEFSRPEYWSG